MLETIGTRPFSWYAEQAPNKLFNEEEEVKAMNRTFFIAGVQFRPKDEIALAMKMIKVEDHLRMEPEPTNKFDPNAVKILYDLPTYEENGSNSPEAFLGYVPKKFSAEVSGLLEAEVDLECIVDFVAYSVKPWEMCRVTIREPKEEEENG